MILFTMFYFTISSPLLTIGFFFFFFNDTATTEIYTLSLHDALPISFDARNTFLPKVTPFRQNQFGASFGGPVWIPKLYQDRKSTRLNSSHLVISYAVFCLKKKKTTKSIQLSTLQLSCPTS